MTVQLYQLDPTNDANEYQRVESHFKKSCSNYIVSIKRLQNPALYRTYTTQKRRMDEAKGSNEQWLFHGTPGEYCRHINYTGFKGSFHGGHGKENMIMTFIPIINRIITNKSTQNCLK